MVDGVADPCLFDTCALLEHSRGRGNRTGRYKNESALIGRYDAGR